jgi:tRNA (guanine37-N1)-methyltransferase
MTLAGDDNMRIDLITIFPDYFAPLSLSLIGKARERGLLDVRVHDLRKWAADPHRTVDDTPYGGGPGMVMTPEPWAQALAAVAPAGLDPAGLDPAGLDPAGLDPAGLDPAGLDPAGLDPAGMVPRLVVPTPSGHLFCQRRALDYASTPWLVFACGRYEGIDARVVDEARTRMLVDEVSIGDYVLAGGEAAALVIVEAVARLLPGVVGNAASLAEESHMAGLLEAPAYTKPAIWRGRAAPDVLLSGNHGAIARWRRDQALRRTAERRPDLLARLDMGQLDDHDRQVVAEILGDPW